MLCFLRLLLFVSIPKGAIMRKKAAEESKKFAGFNSKRCDYENTLQR